MERPRAKKDPKAELVRRAIQHRDELPDILDAEDRQHEHEAAEEAVRWIEEKARRVQNALTAPPDKRHTGG